MIVFFNIVLKFFDKKLLTFLGLAMMFFMCEIGNAKAYDVTEMRVGAGIGNIRIVFDASKDFNYKVFLLDAPKRMVIDIVGASVSANVENGSKGSEVIESTRIGTPNGRETRIVFDLKKPVIIKKVFMLPPQSSFGWRFVVDVAPASNKEFLASIGNDNIFSKIDDVVDASFSNSNNNIPIKSKIDNKSKKIIVLDPGHGGKDPGAIGYSGVYEKNITLAMAKELKEQLDKDSQYKVYLTRSNDTFITLRERVKIARKHDADLFISIHADSAKNRNAIGLSVYTLSETASDKEAEALADRENKADIIAGLNLVEHSKEVSDILINLAQRETMNRSSEFATMMVVEMKKSVKLVSNTHRFAGFAVLKAPDVPSVLLEMGYLSNRNEEKLLQQKSYRTKLVTSTKKSIDAYFKGM